ncbi:MAG TPA: zinc-binding dehydrogenase [Chloroflexota bacterium]|nr:zinc-binding dehydrogenase [Chloroflexota bacterium]
MRAIRIHAVGGSEVLKYEEVPVPEAGRNEVLVRLRAAAVNRVDILLREGRLPIGKALPHILGTDGAGAVVRGGGGDARSGDRVLVTGDTLGRLRDGTYAEYVVVPNSMVVPIPQDMRYEDAVAMGTAALTAWQAVVDRGSLVPGQWVLIHAAGSGVGVTAIQIAKLLGARVIVTAGADSKLDRARKLGADFAINYTHGDFALQVKSITNNRGAEVVIDPVGGEILRRSLECVAPGGKIVSVGMVAGSDVVLDLRKLIPRGISVVGLHAGALPPYQIADRYRQIAQLLTQGRLHPVIDQVLPLAEAATAHQLLMQRLHFGKIVLRI